MTQEDDSPLVLMRAQNGFRVVIVAFIVVLIAFGGVLWFWSAHIGQDTIKAADALALMGVITGVVGALVGTFFGVSSANAARDSMSNQLQTASTARDAATTKLAQSQELNAKLSGALPPDQAKAILDQTAPPK